MTKRQRAEVVELLRCAVDEDSLSNAAFKLDAGTDTWQWALAARDAVDTFWWAPESDLRLVLLEAALRVEQGEWP